MVMLIYQCEGLVDGWSLAIALLAIAHLDHSKSSQLEVGYVSCFFYYLSFSEVYLIIVWAMLVVQNLHTRFCNPNTSLLKPRFH